MESSGRSYSGTWEEVIELPAALVQLSLVVDTFPPKHIQTSPVSLQYISITDPVLFVVVEYSCIK